MKCLHGIQLPYVKQAESNRTEPNQGESNERERERKTKHKTITRSHPTTK